MQMFPPQFHILSKVSAILDNVFQAFARPNSNQLESFFNG